MGEVKEEKVYDTEIAPTQHLFMANVKEEKVYDSEFWNMLMALPPKQEPEDLNLSLTLGSAYSEESKEFQLLSRSSSTIEITTLNMDLDKVDSVFPGTYLSLARTCSLPSEAEQKPACAGAFKGLQRRRFECAKRVVKQGSFRGRLEKTSGADTMPNSPSKIPAWAAASAARSPAFCRAIVKLKAHNSLPANAQPEVAQASAENIITDTAPGSLAKRVILQAFKDAKTFQDSQRNQSHPSKKPKLPKSHVSEETGAEMIEKMPSVTTTGPTGKQVEGVLYMYRRNQVNIVCICHGRFLTPAEFVRHAGCKDVENPMKHIKVRLPSSS